MGEITPRMISGTPRPLSWSESASLLGVVCYESEPHSPLEWIHSFSPSLHWSELLKEWTPLILGVNSLFWCFTPLEWLTGGVKCTHFWSDITPKFLQCVYVYMYTCTRSMHVLYYYIIIILLYHACENSTIISISLLWQLQEKSTLTKFMDSIHQSIHYYLFTCLFFGFCSIPVMCVGMCFLRSCSLWHELSAEQLLKNYTFPHCDLFVSYFSFSSKIPQPWLRES